MGYYYVIPPIPTRYHEKEMMKKLEDDWLSQPWYRYYMNENLRRRKMEHATDRKRMWSDYFLNMAYYGTLMLPFTLMLTRFTRYSATRVPVHYKPNFFLMQRSAAQARVYLTFRLQVAFWALSTIYLTEKNADYSFITDEDYRDAKDHVIM